MFRSHSLIALPVLLLPLYGAATALPQAVQNPQMESAQSCSIATPETAPAVQKAIAPQASASQIDATSTQPQDKQVSREKPKSSSAH
jgi:hypothetical protein